MTCECPICCDDLTESDQLFKLDCPTKTCNYNYCVDCITQFLKSAKDGYQEASDGSRQVKISVCCPQCRSKYKSDKYSSEIIVESVLLLRQAHSLSDRMHQGDSELSATELGQKYSFLHTTSLEHLHDAHRRLQIYHDEIGKEPVPPLDWNKWKNVLPDKKANSRKSSMFIDPTLFLGLEDFMTAEEQIYVTQLLTCGNNEGLAQAAFILHSVLQVVATRQAKLAVQALSSFSQKPTFDTHKIRKLFPLPNRMPRCVVLPVYDPEGSKRLLKFKQDSLELAQVRGPAGQSGLRKGDLVTHVQGEAVETAERFQQVLLRLYTEEENFMVVVNADGETAQALEERAQKMRKAKVYS